MAVSAVAEMAVKQNRTTGAHCCQRRTPFKREASLSSTLPGGGSEGGGEGGDGEGEEGDEEDEGGAVCLQYSS